MFWANILTVQSSYFDWSHNDGSVIHWASTSAGCVLFRHSYYFGESEQKMSSKTGKWRIPWHISSKHIMHSPASVVNTSSKNLKSEYDKSSCIKVISRTTEYSWVLFTDAIKNSIVFRHQKPSTNPKIRTVLALSLSSFRSIRNVFCSL